MTDYKLLQYYVFGKYKGFVLKHAAYLHEEPRKTYLVFTNGVTDVEATGRFREEALLNIFEKIDGKLVPVAEPTEIFTT
ncbi:MAG: hypothetical protein R3281_14555 [Balneolaceae bacterium]|nr:hypothetical protein [Balneolaceae bacterium]